MKPITTPQRLGVLVGFGWVLIGILAAMITSSAFEHRDAVHAIGIDAAPSVVAAHRIKIEVESLDADLVNEMLVTSGRQADGWSADFAKNRIELGRHMLAAARSAFGDDEEASLQSLDDTFGRYLMAAQETIDAHRRGETVEAIATYRTAFQILETEMIPAASKLDEISDADLERAYERQEHHSDSIRTFIGAFGLLLIGVLVAIQGYISARFRRRLSLGILGAIALVVTLMIYTLGAFRANDADLTQLKQSYDTVDRALASLASAYEAKSSQSRALFDRDRAPAARQRFVDFANQVKAVTQDFNRYRAHDEQLRKLAGDEAIAFTLTGESALAFDAFDQALETFVKTDDDEVHAHTEAAFAAVQRVPIVAPILSLLIAISLWLGLRPRLKEYAR